MNESKKRRHFSAEQKADVVRRHLVGKTPVSDLADELGVQPNQICRPLKSCSRKAAKGIVRGATPLNRNYGLC